MENVNSTKVVTGKCRFSFVNIIEPRAFAEGQPAKYSVMLLIPKTDTVTIGKIKSAIEAAVLKGLQSKFGGKRPPVVKTTFKDVDIDTDQDGTPLVEKWPYAAGHMCINVSSTDQPKVVDKDCVPMLDLSTVYSGCYGRASINFFAYNSAGNKGISAGLCNLQFLEDGEPLGSQSTPENDFGGNNAYNG